MFYEEKIINGVLCYRGLPTERFRPLSPEAMTARIIEREDQVKFLISQVESLSK